MFVCFLYRYAVVIFILWAVGANIMPLNLRVEMLYLHDKGIINLSLKNFYRYTFVIIFVCREVVVHNSIHDRKYIDSPVRTLVYYFTQHSAS